MYVIDGQKSLESRAHRAKANMNDALDRYTELAAKEIWAYSQILVPVATLEDAASRGTVPGSLKRSGHVARHGHADYTVEYGGPDAPYAIYVHEILSYYHRPPTQAKFLEQPYDELKGQLSEGVINGIKRAIR
jgi:hypothetical protein